MNTIHNSLTSPRIKARLRLCAAFAPPGVTLNTRILLLNPHPKCSDIIDPPHTPIKAAVAGIRPEEPEHPLNIQAEEAISQVCPRAPSAILYYRYPEEAISQVCPASQDPCPR